jgi:prepilin-type processing-associated H-X9-DG protein
MPYNYFQPKERMLEMKKTFLGFLAIFAVCCLNLSVNAGDKQDDDKLFDKVSSKLDKGGSYFNYQNNKYLFRAIENTYNQLPAAIKVMVPDQNQQMIPFMVYNCIKPIVKELGIDEMLAAGASSALICEKTDKNPALFRSRQYIYFGDKELKGLLWTGIAGENQELASLSSLPKETLFASESKFKPAMMWEKLKKAFPSIPMPFIQGVPVTAEQNFQRNFNIKLVDFLDGLSGSWSVVMLESKDDAGKTAILAMIKVPNKNDMTFKVLFEMAKDNPLLEVLPDQIKLKEATEFSWLKPAVLKDEKNLYIVSNPEILNIIKEQKDSESSLVSTEKFKFLSQDLPEKGLAYCYFDSRTLNVIIEMIKANAPVGDKDWTVLTKLLPQSDSFMIVSKDKEGVMYTLNSPMDIPQFVTYLSAMPSILQAAALLPALNRSRVKARTISCMSNLKQIGLALKMYAMDHEDDFPAGNNVSGLNDLVKEDYLTDMAVYACPNTKTVKAAGKELKEENSSYIYIGGFKEGDGPDIPMVFDKLDSGRGYVNVLYQDGHVAAVKGNFSTSLALINHLAKSSQYKPEILKKLQEKAEEIDKQFGYK